MRYFPVILFLFANCGLTSRPSYVFDNKTESNVRIFFSDSNHKDSLLELNDGSYRSEQRIELQWGETHLIDMDIDSDKSFVYVGFENSEDYLSFIIFNNKEQDFSFALTYEAIVPVHSHKLGQPKIIPATDIVEYQSNSETLPIGACFPLQGDCVDEQLASDCDYSSFFFVGSACSSLGSCQNSDTSTCTLTTETDCNQSNEVFEPGTYCD